MLMGWPLYKLGGDQRERSNMGTCGRGKQPDLICNLRREVVTCLVPSAGTPSLLALWACVTFTTLISPSECG